MHQRRVCDACSVRRVKCSREDPCLQCNEASLDCTRSRARLKTGPRGIRKKTFQKLIAVTRAQPPGSQSVQRGNALHDGGSFCLDRQNSSTADPSRYRVDSEAYSPSQRAPSPTFSHLTSLNSETQDSRTFASTLEASTSYPYKLDLELIRLYLDIYYQRLYSVWPIVDRASLIAGLSDSQPAVDVYLLASSVCVATKLQLQLTATGPDSTVIEPELITNEIEDLRRSHGYQDHPTLDTLSVSFFLHVAYLHIGRHNASTLLLREAISIGHLLELHKAAHYEDLSEWQVQEDLRKLWLLFITERYLVL